MHTKIKKIIYFCIFISLFCYGCGKKKDNPTNKNISRVVVDYEKESMKCCVRINFNTGIRSVTLHATEIIKTEDTYAYIDELDVFVHENILTDSNFGKNTGNDSKKDVQKKLWNIRVYFDDNSWTDLTSYSDNPYTPSYYNDFISLIEK